MGLSNTQKGILLAFVGYNFFTMSDTCIKLLTASYSISTISFWSSFIVLLMSLIFALLKGVKKTLGSRKILIHIARSIFVLIASVCAVAAFSKGLSLATFYTILFLCPVVTAIGAALVYKERISRLSWSVILLGFAGIIVAFVKDASFSSPAIIYAVGVLFFGALVNLMARPIDKRESMLTFPFYPSVVIVFSFLVYIVLYKGESVPIPAVADIPVFAINGFCIFMAQMFVLQGFRIAPHAYVAPTQYTQMISGIVAGYYVFGDVPGPWVFVGAGIIIASGLLLVTQKKEYGA
ncbi:MAG: DMT family transporter [Alphaproteobacteria bacterium]|nr:DMT family transporter [Alphaproteobacteria bacterium]